MTETEEEGARPAVGEIRTFLIADVRGYTRFTLEHGDQAAAKLAVQFAAIAREVTGTHEGQVIELRGDEALAVFSSVRQALRAAVNLQDRFARETIVHTALPLQVGIGLDAGEAVLVEGGYRGAALNLAARLCSLAGPGEVLASEGVVHLARKVSGLAYAERGAVQLKGFVEAVRVVQVVPEQAEPQSEVVRETETTRERPLPIGGFLGALPAGPLVARDAELESMLAAVDAVAGRSGRLVFLAGEPGIGKTRLAQEATLQLRNRGFLVATGRCYQPQGAVPFYPFLEALSSLYAAAPPLLQTSTPQRWPYLAHLLPNKNLPVPVVSSEGQEAQERLFWSVTGFLQAISEVMPVALLLDDLHWADSTSLGLLQHLARHTRADRILLLGTYRDVEVGRQHPLERALRDLHREQLVERVSIRRLEQHGTAALIATTFGEEKVSTEFSELVHRHTEGNPFFTNEVLRALVERGDVYREHGQWERRAVAEIEVPETVRLAIDERLSRLTESAQEMLRHASVLGQTFAFEALQGMGSHTEEEAEVALDEATAAGLIREIGRDTYSFNHALIQQALYSELPGRRKRRLHRAAGEALEQQPGRIRDRRAAELAWHFLEGDDAERALRYSLRAGDEAEAVFAHEEAERHYRTALDLARHVDDRNREAAALEKIGAVFYAGGRYDGAVDLLEQAAHLYASGERPGDERRVWALIGRSHAYGGTSDRGLDRLRAVLDRVPPDSTPQPGLAALHASLAQLLFVRSQMPEALVSIDRALELAHLEGDDRTLVFAGMRRGTVLILLNRPREAREALQQAIPLAEGHGDLHTLAYILYNLCDLCLEEGRLREGKQYGARVLELNERRQAAPGERGNALAEMGWAHFLLGEWGEARQCHDRAVRLARTDPPTWFTPFPLFARGVLYAALGDEDAATMDLQCALESAQVVHHWEALQNTRRALAERELFAGRPEAAYALLAPGVAKGALSANRLLPWLAWALLGLGRHDQAEETILRYLQDASTRGHRGDLSEAQQVDGMIASSRGQWARAKRSLLDAVALARDIACPYTEARALYRLGRMYTQKDERGEAREHLMDAQSVFQRLGARPDIERTEYALAELE
jgi:class 3 adenylate cyclase/tetratricopeptide (TPR) repeat protein